MEKIIFTFLLLMSLSFGNMAQAAYDDFPLEGDDWDNITLRELYTNRNEEAFLALYKITEENLDSEKAFRAFSALRSISQRIKTDYEQNRLKSDKLKKVMGELLDGIKNPKTVKDYFFRALFEVPKDKKKLVSQQQYDYFQLVVKKFPSSTYAEFSIIIMSDLLYIVKDFKTTNRLLTEYLRKYGKDAKLRPHVYYRFATMYEKLLKGKADKDDKKYKDPEKKIDFMISYADGLYEEYPKFQKLISEVSIAIHNYYFRIGEYDKALKYIKRVYETPDPSIHYLDQGIYRAISIFKVKKDVKGLDELLEYVKANHFTNSKVRKLYKEFKLNVEEINRFGYDRYDKETSEKVYEAKKAEIDKYKTLYESCWDEWNNLIKPLPK